MRMRNLLLAALAAMALPAAAADRISIANEGTIGDKWTLVPGTQLMPPYPEAYAKDPEQVCLVIGYLLNADGHTSDFALLKSWASGSNSRSRTSFWAEFSDLASRAMSQWRFVPKAGVASPEPVYTAVTFVFGSPDATAATQQHCAIADLTTRLLELRYDDRAGRMMSRGIFSRLDIDPNMEERLRQAQLRQHEARTRSRELTARPTPPAPAPPPPPPGH